MPVYEFKCNECGKVFEDLRSVGDYSDAECPKCHSKNTEKVFSLISGSGNSCDTCTPSPGG